MAMVGDQKRKATKQEETSDATSEECLGTDVMQSSFDKSMWGEYGDIDIHVTVYFS